LDRYCRAFAADKTCHKKADELPSHLDDRRKALNTRIEVCVGTKYGVSTKRVELAEPNALTPKESVCAPVL
jgi:hypothetical protein